MTTQQQKQIGFTMVELIITIGILGVLVAFATPAMITTMRKTQLNSEARAVIEAIQQSRTEAVVRKRSETVALPALKHTTMTPTGVSVQYDFMGRASFSRHATNGCLNIVLKHAKDPSVVASIEVREVGSPDILKLEQSQCR